MSLYKGINLMLLSFLKGVGVLICLWHWAHMFMSYKWTQIVLVIFQGGGGILGAYD